MAMTRSKYIKKFISWVGKKESDGTHKDIIDIYNSQKNLPRGYRVRYDDMWCAPTVSACAIATGMEKIIPIECSCGRMIERAKVMGIWVEEDGYVPEKGDIIFYDWDDDGKGDCKGWPEHTGAVVQVNNGMITVIEGNKNDEVGYRHIVVNARFIRGYACPKYEEEVEEKPHKLNPVSNKTFAISNKKNPSASPIFKVKTRIKGANVRKWAGLEYDKTSFSGLKKGTEVEVCDAILSKGKVWYYIQYNGKRGFISSWCLEW